MSRSVNFLSSSAMLPVFWLIVAVIFNDATATARNYEKDFEDKLSLLGPRSLIESVNKDEIAQNYTCGRDLAILGKAITKQEMWAMKMLDASSKIPSGLLEGNTIDLGMFDECMSVKGESQGIEIRGNHCMYSITLTNGNATLPITPTLSICMPSTCNGSDIVHMFDSLISTINELKNIKIVISSATCTPADEEICDTEFTVCFSILIAFTGLLLFCTLCDVILWQRDTGKYKYPVLSTLAKFSFIKSASSILSTNVREGNLPAIHGIRFLSMGWIVLGHEYNVYFLSANVNTASILNWAQSWKSLYIFTAPFAVDTFLTISGFLMTYLFLKQMPKQKSFNVPMYYLHRYFRLTPALIALLIFSIVFVPKIGSGPLWDKLIPVFVGSCREKWWKNLLYVQNFVEKENMCLGHLWYLAVDMQLFWISPIFISSLQKNKIRPSCCTRIFFSLLDSSRSDYRNQQDTAFSFINSKNNLQLNSEVYKMPYNRAGPWLIGILLGFEVANNNRRLGKSAILAGWLITIGAFAFCTFGTRSFMETSYEYNVIWESFFTAVSRPIWGLGVCWIIYACLHNYAGPVSYVLSWKFLLPLSRISYCVYLVHIVIQLMHQSAIRIPNYFSDYYIWHDFLSHLVTSVVIGFFFSLLFESPFMVLEKMLFRRKRASAKESQENLRSEGSKDEQA
ncbi:LOW QUALITY PROTEIN: nose resistant to fluoxetine protein 6 [Nasonia vitripennis]|uniref:Nose resistant-to-fluoxetine protein N-terminal domain-containing protein n=1 Tax=Nasonia vitripennis TaxID=7425 RepID=A0A7M7Q2P3_NASVI|nr:LOW QUALITY PROTEIN: nose resistant to fluoxetine protein 6 [Nasonia vitripennis]